MTKSKFLNACKRFLFLVPEVEKPTRKVEFQDKIMWTVFATLIFLVASQVPVFGIRPAHASDPFYWMRHIVASNKGTIMELGISPLVTASLVLQLLSGSRIIAVDETKKEEQQLFQSVQKLAGLAVTLVEAVVYVISGMYGDVWEIGPIFAVGIVIQLLLAGLVCTMLDELLQKSYGFGSGISLFIAVNICETIVWKMFSPQTVSTGRGTEFEGAVIALFHLMVARSDKARALKEALYRPHMPNLTNVLATVVVFLVVVFVQGYKVDLRIHSTDRRGVQGSYPIKLFYTSNMPIILLTSLISNLYFFSQVLHKHFAGNVFVNLIGKWSEPEYAGNLAGSVPVGGLAYYVSAPQSLWDLWEDPAHALFYVVFVLTTCALFSKVWIEVSGSSARDVAKQLLENHQTLPGFRANENDLTKELNRYIPTAAALGGLCIGALTVAGDFLGAIGSGTGILLVVTIINQYFELFTRESKGGSMLPSLGGTRGFF